MTTPIYIHIENHKTILWQQEYSLLEALENAGIDINHSCRLGVCGSCCVQLIKGKVAWRTQPLEPPVSNVLLACSVIPITDIYIRLNHFSH